ncbi:MAG: hypothetical protein J1F25_04460 [Prevotellaceae bacterium]|nr:hypothetical protein [Prevotellaceae bacterium]
MKKSIFMLAILASTALTTSLRAQDNPSETKQKTERTIALWGHVFDHLTKAGIKDTYITLMTADSAVVDTGRVFSQTMYNAVKADYAYRFNVPAKPQKYIIRAEHPDYEPCYVNYEVKHIARNTYFDAPYHYMKRRPRNYEMEGGELGGVAIKATKVKVVYRGDTIVYNADAFNLPEGSMLDALVRQLDGAELKDDGRIFVNGTQIDELTLNGKEFFKGNNKVMLENLPSYTVQNIQVYHKTDELSEYLGYDVAQKKYVMDVVLKREYAQGWLANVEVAGGTPFGEKDPDGNTFDDRYLARLFAMRYTDNSRLSFFANTNNVNENRKPGSNGEWSPGYMPNEHTTQDAGIDLMIDEAQKRWQENASIRVNRGTSLNTTTTAAEHFLANSSSTFSRNYSRSKGTDWSISGYNSFRLKKPFYLMHDVSASYNHDENNSHRIGMSTLTDPSYWGNTRAALDSVFALSLSPSKQAEIINRNRSRARNQSNRSSISTQAIFNYKLANGDDLGLNASASRNHSHNRNTNMEQIDYLQTDGGSNVAQHRYTRIPYNQYQFSISPDYTISLLNGWKFITFYHYTQTGTDQTNDAFLLDRLGGIYLPNIGNAFADDETFGLLPSTRDSLLLAIDATNTYKQSHLRHEHLLCIRPQYNYNKNGKYVFANISLNGYNVRERLHYVSAATDTTLRHNTYTFSPSISAMYATDNWHKQLNFNYSIEMKTPDLYGRVNVLNDANPLALRIGNPDLKGPTIHRMQTSFSRTWDKRRTFFNFGGGLRFFLNQVSQGYTYDAKTGVYTYMPVNVDGNWQTYFFHTFNRNIDPKERLNLYNYMHGDYTRNVDHATATGEGATSSVLSHVNNYYIEDRLTLNYRFEDLTVGAQFYGELRHANNTERTIATINAVNFSYGLNTTYNFKRESFAKWLRGLSLTTDIKMFSRRGYGDASLNRDELVWNAGLSRTFLNPFGHAAGGSITARLEAFDILGQLSSTTIVINGQGRTETVQNTLPRYLMLHLTYNFSKIPKNREKK